MSLSDRFELFELVREGEVQTFRARERATGLAVEVHQAASPGLLAKLASSNVMDRGSQEGKHYIVTPPLSLESVGAWRIKPTEQATPGDFTQMFQLRQAPEPIASPEVRVAQAPAAAKPGQFTQAFKRPAAAPASAPAGSAAPGEPGEFTRMFQRPPSAPPALDVAPSSVRVGRRVGRAVGVIVAAIVIILAIAVFVLFRTLY